MSNINQLKKLIYKSTKLEKIVGASLYAILFVFFVI